MIFLHFQFPDETENKQSPPANKNRNYTYKFNLVDLNRNE